MAQSFTEVARGPVGHLQAFIESGKKVVPPGTVVERDEKHKLEFRMLAHKDVPAVTKTMAVSFVKGEPLCGQLGLTVEDMETFCAGYVLRMVDEGLTVVASNAETGEVLGAMLTEDFCNPDLPGLGDVIGTMKGNFGPIGCIIDSLEQTLMTAKSIPTAASDRPKGVWCHLWMLGVLPTARGMGLGKRLIAHSLDCAKLMGFQYAFAECTGKISTHVLTSLCQQLVLTEKLAFVDYAKWQGDDEGECDEQAVKAVNDVIKTGHTGMTMVLVHLDKPVQKEAKQDENSSTGIHRSATRAEAKPTPSGAEQGGQGVERGSLVAQAEQAAETTTETTESGSSTLETSSKQDGQAEAPAP